MEITRVQQSAVNIMETSKQDYGTVHVEQRCPQRNVKALTWIVLENILKKIFKQHEHWYKTYTTLDAQGSKDERPDYGVCGVTGRTKKIEQDSNERVIKEHRLW